MTKQEAAEILTIKLYELLKEWESFATPETLDDYKTLAEAYKIAIDTLEEAECETTNSEDVQTPDNG